MIFVRSLAYNLVLWTTSIFFPLTSPLLLPLPWRWRYAWLSRFAWVNVYALRVLCGVRWEVEGKERMPAGPAIILGKHQSTWETFGFQTIFPPQSFLLKRSLLWIPFFGWGLAMMRPIAIDRSAGRQALKILVEQGLKRLKQGNWVVIYPEGTRIAPGERGHYHQGGAYLAVKTGYPVIPVAHNAGECWPRHRFLKYPGTIRVVIGEPIQPAGKKPAQLTAEVEAWIEARMAEISPLSARAAAERSQEAPE